jgi:hypothetical protein
MGDRTYCSLYVFGSATQAQLDALGDALECVEQSENFFGFEEMNYGDPTDDQVKILNASGLSWSWHWESGDEYPEGMYLHNAETCETTNWLTNDGEMILSMGGVKNPVELERAMRYYDWLMAQKFTLIEPEVVA